MLFYTPDGSDPTRRFAGNLIVLVLDMQAYFLDASSHA
jgi:hypothetical protein